MTVWEPDINTTSFEVRKFTKHVGIPNQSGQCTDSSGFDDDRDYPDYLQYMHEYM